MKDLIAALEKAQEGTWQLDSEIHVAVGRCLHRETHTVYYEEGESSDSTTRCKDCGVDTYGVSVPQYSRSIDAALTLVPHVEPRTHWHLQCYPHGCYSATVSDKYPVGSHYCGQHMTSPAIALCIAALKART